MTAYILLGNIVASIGISALFNSITSITNTSKNIYSLLNNIAESQDTYIKNNINKLDLEFTIKIMQCLFEDINMNLEETPGDKDTFLQTFRENKIKSKSIVLCIDSLKHTIGDIEIQLLKLNSIIKYNKSLWIFQRLRMIDCSKIFNMLSEYKLILDSRKKLLFELLLIKTCSSVYINNEIMDMK